MDLVDCRRLTGPSIVSDVPCAVVEAEVAVEETEPVIAEWTRQVRRMLDAAGWPQETTSAHRVHGGVMLVLTAPADGLYAATEIAEWGWQATRAARAGDEAPDFEADAEGFRRVIAEEANPALLELAAAARAHDVIFLADEERASVGLGTGVRSWPARALPDTADVPWKGVHDIPVALIGGSLGKTTCVRLVAAMVDAAGKRAGYSTSTALTIGEDIIERGDCADAQSARELLRERRVQIALLETPREELWHRGLPVPRASAALITGVAEAPSSELGARNAQELADVTWLVTRALGSTQPLVLNVDDEVLIARSARVRGPVVWYGANADLPALASQIERGAMVWTVRDGTLGHQRGRQWRGILPVAELSSGADAASPHGVSNALAAAALAQALGLPERSIIGGLRAPEHAKAGVRA